MTVKMTLPGFAWMLTECGHITALPAGTPGADALCTGPVYEVSLRGQPSVKLLYSHKPSSNVNPRATTLAGHSISGDACLVFSPSSSFTSPAVLLDSVLRGPASTESASTESASTESACTTSFATTNRTTITTKPQQLSAQTCSSARPLSQSSPNSQQQQQQQQHCGSPNHLSSPVPASTPTGRPRRPPFQQQQQQRWRTPIQPPPPGIQQRQIAMRAILRSRNAAPNPTPASPTSTPTSPASDVTMTSPASPSPTSITAGMTNTPTPSCLPVWAPLSGGEDLQEHVLTDAAPVGSVVAAAGLCPPRLGGCKTPPPPPSTVAANVSRMEPMCDGCRECDEGRASGADGAGGGGGYLGIEVVGRGTVVPEQTPPPSCQPPHQPHHQLTKWGCGGESEESGKGLVSELQLWRVGADLLVERRELPANVPGPSVCDVPWGELAGDVVACIAMHLPPRASEVQPLLAVCRSWRDALLGHPPLLRRTAFSLDLAQPLRRKDHSCNSATTTTTATATETSNPRTGARVGGFKDKHGEEDGDGILGMASAMARQHSRGAFLLPSHGSRQLPAECAQTEQPGDKVPYSTTSAWHTRESGAATAAGPEEVVVVAPAVIRLLLLGSASSSSSSSLPQHRLALPRLLFAAAQASNPSAQLVMAQVLEAADDHRGALRWWRKVAATGDVMATFKLGMASYDGSHGLETDFEAAHLWLSRNIKALLAVDSLSAISLDGHQGAGVGQSRGAKAPGAELQRGVGGKVEAAAGLRAADTIPRRVHLLSPALQTAVSRLDPPRLHMLGWSAIVLGYLEFDRVAGRSVWGMGERSEAVRLFRLAEAAGLAEASAVLGWLYNTGQY